ncbi:hypothetical protein EV363DRAFT_1450076 [Boletus edulis]|nr:hypothetical protein EV363DRAFT_1450076 [Boletus edulis]
MYDLLSQHHATNRCPRSPSPGYLNDVRRNGGRPAPKKPHNASHSENEQECEVDQASSAAGKEGEGRKEKDKEPDGDRGQGKKSATRSKDKEKDASPKDTVLSFYPRRWRPLLDLTKVRMRLHAAVEDAFPRREVAVDGRCLEVLNEVIAYYKTQRFYPEHRTGMCKLIFNDTQTFRSNLKKEVARNLRVEYNILPSKNAKNAKECIAQIKSKAAELLSSASYLRGDPDANQLKKALRQFAEFQPHVPYKVLTLVGAIVHSLLGGLSETTKPYYTLIGAC